METTKGKPTSRVHGKVFEVVKNTKEPIEGIGGQGKYARFGKQGIFSTKDAAFAQDIKQKFGQDGSKDVIVIERDAYESRANKNLWTNPGMPWKDER